MHSTSKSRDSNGDLPLKLPRLICIICQGNTNDGEDLCTEDSYKFIFWGGYFLSITKVVL